MDVHSIGVVGEASRALECIYARPIVFQAAKYFVPSYFLGVADRCRIMVNGTFPEKEHSLIGSSSRNVLGTCAERGLYGQERHGEAATTATA